MKPSPSSMHGLARRLLAANQSAAPTADPHVHEAALVSDRFRITLTRFIGSEGFASILRRAVVLASAEVPSLRGVKIGTDGRLEGLEHDADTESGGQGAVGDQAAVAVTSHLLGLLATFIGTSLTLRLVREAWPDASLNEQDFTIEAK